MISYPYTRLMNANARVDMAAGLILCSLETARARASPTRSSSSSTPRRRRTTATSSRRAPSSTARRRCASRERARSSWRAGASTTIDHFDLYSCFPSSVQVAASGARRSRGPPAHRHRRAHLRRRTAQQLRAARDRAHGRGRARAARLARGSSTATAAGSRSTRSASTPPSPRSTASATRTSQQQVDAFPLREALIDWDGPGDPRGLHRGAPEGRAAHRPRRLSHGRRPPHLGDAGRSRAAARR